MLAPVLGIRVRCSAIGASLALAMVLPSAHVAAQPTAVVVRSAGVSEELALDLAREARARVESEGRVVIAIPPERAAPDLAIGVSAGIAAYHDLRPADALAELDAVLASFERIGVGLTRAELLDALSFRALAAQALGHADVAVAAVDRLLAVDPTYRPDPAQWPPSFRRLLDERRTLAHASSLRLVVTPAPSRVVVDGLAETLVDGSLSLGAGRHVVRVEARGHAPQALVVDLQLEGAERIVTLELDPVAHLRDPGPPDTPTESLVASARALGAELVVIDVVIGSVSLRARLVDSRGRRELLLGEPSRDAATIVARLFTRPSVGEAVPVPPRDRGVSRRVRRRRALLISAAATVALAVSISVPVALRSQDGFVGRWQRDAR